MLRDLGISRAQPDDSRWTNLRNTVRRLRSVEVPNARMVARFGDSATEIEADSGGRFESFLMLDERPPQERLWHEARLELLEPKPTGAVSAATQIMVPDPSADFGIISDIDDTLIRLDVARTIRMLGQVFLGNAHTRLPFPGVRAFFQSLQRGVESSSPRPIFYVSSSPWKLYDVLLHFLELQDIPVGPLELREWGSPLEELRRSRHREHKLSVIRRILDTYPLLPFILIGDSGQQDPETYSQIIEEYPQRVLSVYIRNLQRDPLRERVIRDLADGIESAGSSLVLADDTLAAARHAASRGWIPARTLEIIAADSDVGRWRATSHQRARTAVVDKPS